MSKITQAELFKALNYDSSGFFTRKVNSYQNTVKAGSVVGWIGTSGYFKTGIHGREYYIHRLVWLWHHGYHPEHNIDHIDRNPLNNKIENLREATQSCNMRNVGLKKRNISGINGVVWYKRDSKWFANIVINKKQFYLGKYKSLNEAAHARYSAEQVFGWDVCGGTTSAYEHVKTNGIV